MPRRSGRSLSVLAVLTMLCAAWLGQPTAASAQLPLGEEFRVNSYTTNDQERTTVASQPDGSFVVVWNSRDQDGDDWGVFGQRYDRDGSPLGGEFQVNSYTTGQQVSDRGGAAAADAEGNFVVAWYSVGPAGPSIVGQRYDAVGNPLGGEFLVSSYRPSTPSLAMDAEGNFVAVWWTPDGIAGRRIDASGTPIGSEFPVSQATGRFVHYGENVAADENGDFVVTWTAGVYYGPPFQRTIYQEVFARRYDAAGNALGNAFQVNSLEDRHQGNPDIVMDPDGAFLIVWDSFWTCPLDEDSCSAPAGPRSVDFGINGQLFDAEGQPIGGEFQVSPWTTGYDRFPRVARRTENDFVVVWNDSSYPSSPPQDVRGRIVKDSGFPLGSEFIVNTYATGRQELADVAPIASGEFVVVWQGPGSTDPSGVFGRLYTQAEFTLSVDGICPGPITVSILKGPPGSEVAVITAANDNGFVKGGALCNGTELEIGEPFNLPPTFIILDEDGNGFAELELGFNRCWVQALALSSCETTNVVRVR